MSSGSWNIYSKKRRKKKRRNNYRKGAQFERTVKAELQRQGWMVFRVAGSRGPFDLIALRGREVMLIQCKAYALSEGELKALLTYLEENVRAHGISNVTVAVAWRDNKQIKIKTV